MKRVMIMITVLALIAYGCAGKQGTGDNDELSGAELGGSAKTSGIDGGAANSDEGEGETAGGKTGGDLSTDKADHAATAGESDDVKEVQTAADGGAVTSLEGLQHFENWETAYPFIEALGKPALEISPDFPKWNPQGSFNGGEYFYDSVNEVFYVFPCNYFMGEDGYNAEQLQGNEVCVMVSAPVGLFFPEAQWPAEGTAEYLADFLGFEFEEYDYEGKGYLASFEDTNEYVDISCEDDGVVGPDNFIQIRRKQ
ncbi:MAG: hypothetical protein FWG42_04810 [Clostridiales bacterium]|nr:hypothetical protein [Clostridiales bacterium]